MKNISEFSGYFKIQVRRGILNNLPEVLCIHNYFRPLFIIDKKILKKVQFTNYFKNKQNFFVFDLGQEPTYEYLENIAKKFCYYKKYDCICGVGGGSVMDFAKGMAILLTNHGSAISFRGFPKLKNKPLPVVTVPSTVGTGSEIIYNASFTDTNTNQKLGINSTDNYPRLTLLDPKLAQAAPAHVFRSTGCDLLVHLVEGFLSQKSTIPSREFSQTAFRLWSQAFPKILNGSKCIDVWEKLQWSSVFAMLGLSNSSSGPSGAFSYYLGPIHRIPHGIAGAFFLRHVLKITYRHKDLSLEGLSHDKSPVLDKVLRILDLAKIPKTLNGLGINNFDKNKFFEFSKKVSAARKLHSIPFTMKMVEELVEEIS
jgi:alcohol dehydrogenase class IV